MILTANVFTYQRAKMLDRCLESISPICDRINVANGHIKAEVRQIWGDNPPPFSTDDTEIILSKWREKLRGKCVLEWWNREAYNFQDQSNYLVRRCPMNEWFFWICDDEALLGDVSGIRDWLESEPTDFGTTINRGRTNPVPYPLLYSRFIRRRDDTEFFPVHWQVIHQHQHIDLYNKKLSFRVYDKAEMWDLEEYPGPGLPSLEEAKNWKPHPTQ